MQSTEMEENGSKQQAQAVTPSNEFIPQTSWTSPKLLRCSFRYRVAGVIALVLLQLPVFAYFYISSSYVFSISSSSWQSAFVWTLHNETEASKTMENMNVTNSRKIITVGKYVATVSDLTSVSLPAERTILSTVPSISVEFVASNGSILQTCPPEPPGLQGRLQISFNQAAKTFEQTKLDNPLLSKGGHGKPPLCTARHKLAIIIPYRDRAEHLRYFVQFMHSTFQRQQVDYQIFIINQLGHGKFNRAKLMNVGFLEALKLYSFECFAFHDVDLILEDDRSLYWCSDRPRHMSAGVDKFNYRLPYGAIFGGVTLLSRQQMESINGFSNEFWGWGGEDDDVYNRLKIKGLKIVRYPMEIARYKMVRHKREKGNEANPKRFELIRKTHLTYKKDGLNTIKYKVISIDFQPTYTNVTVDLLGPN